MLPTQLLMKRAVLTCLAACALMLFLPTLAFADAPVPVAPPGLPWWVLAWPIVSGVASLLYTVLDQYPRAHAFFSLLAKAGVDLPAILDALHRLWTGLTPAQKAAAKALAKGAAVIVFSVKLVMAVSACGPGQLFGPGSALPSDMEADAACVTKEVISGDLDPAKVLVACALQEGQTFDDLWAWVVNSLKSKGKLTAEKATTAMKNMEAARAARGVK